MTTEIEDAELSDTQPPTEIQLTVNDLMVCRAVLDTATQAGVFKAADLSTVGAVFDKLNIIVEDFISKNNPPAADNTEGDKA